MNWTPVDVRLGDLKPWDRNPKRISKGHAKRLLELWERLGQFQTIAIGPGGEVYDGHQRLNVLKAAHGAGYTVQALQAERALTEAEREELTIAAHVGTTGQFDWDALSGWDAGNLQQWGLDTETLDGWRVDTAAIEELLASSEEAVNVSKINIVPKQFLRVLVSIPVDSALDAKPILDALEKIELVEIDYGGN